MTEQFTYAIYILLCIGFESSSLVLETPIVWENLGFAYSEIDIASTEHHRLL
jgi:hypothetical protein